MTKTDQVSRDFIADVLVLLVILVVMAVGFAAFNAPSILLGGGLALLVAVVAEYVWSRGGASQSSHS